MKKNCLDKLIESTVNSVNSLKKVFEAVSFFLIELELVFNNFSKKFSKKGSYRC